MKKSSFNQIIEQKYPSLMRAILNELKVLVSSKGELIPLYGMSQYHIGFVDENFKKLSQPQTGKIFRPILCLVTNKNLGGTPKKVLPAALAIETFHNFSLIHDDIEDNDEKRRGRTCVWKIWDLDHGVNSGDALFNLSYRALLKIQDPKLFKKIFQKLVRTFGLIVEGQYLDIEMAKRKLTDSWLSTKLYLRMIRRKSAELVGCACEVGALSAGANTKIQKAMYEFGINLGLAYQTYDDFAGIWKKEQDTGKKSLKDIMQKKKALPLIHCLSKGNSTLRKKLAKYYAGPINPAKAAKIAKIFESTGSQEYCQSLSLKYKNQALKIIQKVFPDKKIQSEYQNLVDSLIQFEG